LQQENNKHKQSIEHEESKDGLVPQLDEVGRYPRLETDVTTQQLLLVVATGAGCLFPL
jgi:hypothetical protein